jgi:hypothetical protein
VDVAAGGTVQRKVSYTNPYKQLRVLNLSTSHPHLLSFRPSRVTAPSSATVPVGLIFSAGRVSGSGQGRIAGAHVQVLVFLNDLDDRVEECWKIGVTIV